MNEHAPLSFSASERWTQCPASYQESSKVVPFEGNEYTREGTAAHFLGEQTIKQFLHMKSDKVRPYLGMDTLKDFIQQNMEVPEELQGDLQENIRAVAVYVETVLKLYVEGYEIYLEERVQFGPDNLQLFGTADCVAIHRDKGVLIVMDYKHGRGYTVKVKSNPQLLSYLGSVLDSERFNLRGVHRFFISIVQPRAHESQAPVNSVPVEFDEVWDHMLNVMEARRQALGPNPPYKVGDWCRWCPAIPHCHVIRNTAGEAIKLSDENKESMLAGLAIVEVVEHWAEHLRGAAHNYLEGGGVLEGWTLYPKRAQRKWMDTDGAFHALINAGLTKEDIIEEKLKSPAQAEKLLNVDKWRSIADALVVAQSSGTTLAREDPNREPVGGQQARLQRAAERAKAVGLLQNARQ